MIAVPVITRVVELLVGVARVAAVPDLELSAICVDAVGHIKTFSVVEELDLAIVEGPALGVSSSASLDGHSSTVGVGRSSETLAIVVAWLEEDRGEVGWRLGRDGGGEDEGQEEEGVAEHYCKLRERNVGVEWTWKERGELVFVKI